jgi:ribonuclease T2
MTNLLHRAAALAAIIFLAAIVGGAQAQNQRTDQRQHQAGQFDFYVLSLSWSPTYCEASSERGRQGNEQCSGRPYAFVVHGLWPQYERGFPRDCQVPAPRLNREIVNSMLDLMPAPRLVFNEWDRHGTCSGLSARGYFDLVRQARTAIKIPEAYSELKSPLMVEPAAVEDAFVKANPGLPRDGIAVTCDSRRLTEVRICLTKDLGFRNCAEIDRRACRLEKVVMPPLREGLVQTNAQGRP